MWTLATLPFHDCRTRKVGRSKNTWRYIVCIHGSNGVRCADWTLFQIQRGVREDQRTLPPHPFQFKMLTFKLKKKVLKESESATIHFMIPFYIVEVVIFFITAAKTQYNTIRYSTQYKTIRNFPRASYLFMIQARTYYCDHQYH